jgi:hypothetical protein
LPAFYGLFAAMRLDTKKATKMAISEAEPLAATYQLRRHANGVYG